MGVRLTEGVEFWQGKMMSDPSACVMSDMLELVVSS